MHIEVLHLDETTASTLSIMKIDGVRKFYVLEDAFHEHKIPGETRIPAGTYKITKRTEGVAFSKYKTRFGHQFVPWIREVPNYEYILIHPGNTNLDTKGCLLVGRKAGLANHFMLDESRLAYEALYTLIAAAFDRKEEVSITITR